MTQPPERDANGRFVKTEPVPGSDAPEAGQHPVSHMLFGWVEHPKTPSYLFMGAITLSVLLVLVDLLVSRHEKIEFANMTGFYGLWGFGAFAFAVLSGWPLGAFLRRDEAYYGEAEITPDDVEADR